MLTKNLKRLRLFRRLPNNDKTNAETLSTGVYLMTLLSRNTCHFLFSKTCSFDVSNPHNGVVRMVLKFLIKPTDWKSIGFFKFHESK